MRINKLLLSILLVSTMFVIGCSFVSNYQKSIFHDEKKIIKDADSYIYGIRRGNATGKDLNIKFSSFTGMNTIFKLKSDGENDIVVDYESVVKDGQFKVVLISPDDEVIDIVNDTKEGKDTFNLKDGVSRIKLVGKKAKGEISIKIDSSEDVEIKPVE